jgi:hypothetical protein
VLVIGKTIEKLGVLLAVRVRFLGFGRYGASLSRLSAADSSIYDGEKLNRILAQWGKPPGPEQSAARMRWRDRRLATLKVHIRSQPAS